MQDITVKLEAFEGPLDLLYHLIEKNEIDIYDIPISMITEQYLAYLQEAKERDMENMSEFLLMAATLLEIKSRMLLPNPKKEEEEEKDPRDELVTRLIEYKRFKEVTGEFKLRQEKAALILYKEADDTFRLFREEEEESLEEYLDGITIDDIFRAFEDVMKRREGKIDKIRSGFREVSRDLYTIDEKISYISDLLILNPKVRFSSIFRSDSRKMEVVVTFLALLELIKMKRVKIAQDKNFDEITIMNSGCETNEAIRAGSYN